MNAPPSRSFLYKHRLLLALGLGLAALIAIVANTSVTITTTPPTPSVEAAAEPHVDQPAPSAGLKTQQSVEDAPTELKLDIESARDLADGLDNVWAGMVMGGVLLVCWLATSLLITALFPRAVTRAADLLATQTAKVFAFGVAFWLVFSIALGVSAILCLGLVGIPLMGFLMLFAVGVRWFGLAVLFLWIGRTVFRKKCLADPEPYFPVFVGAAVLAVLHMIPFLNLILWPLTFIPVAGATLLAFAENRRKNRATPDLI